MSFASAEFLNAMLDKLKRMLVQMLVVSLLGFKLANGSFF